jgi:hypothetical protein
VSSVILELAFGNFIQIADQGCQLILHVD